ncbi:hypothetical protein HPB52_020057 [Rhipicephalus sanguineus]|uniref:Uncharacterized protein n=1 Tax=Rhipicephalus sanguineus TaxID=34632 RepID=A0A9D4T487_RHISA|nr:hypothetical protein HPB52_020057 [Rhipicephalus sanguineus]
MKVTWLLLSSLAALVGHGSSWEGDTSTTPENGVGPIRIDDDFPDLRDIAIRLAQRMSWKRRYLLLMMKIAYVNVQATEKGYLVWMGISVVDSTCKMRYPVPDQSQCHPLLCAPLRPCYGWIRVTNGRLNFLWTRCHPPNENSEATNC